MKTVLEAVPPERHRGQAALEKVLEKVAAVQAHTPVDLVNIPEIHEEPARSDKGERRQPFAPRMAPRDLAQIIRERLGIECMINHVVVHHHSEQALVDWARETWERCGVRQMVLVGGGRRSVRYPGPGVARANALLRDADGVPGLRIGNICIPSRRDEAARMAEKVGAGADFFTTQILYESDGFSQMLAALSAAGRAPAEVLVAFCPIRSVRNLRFLQWLGVGVPEALEAWLVADETDITRRSLEQIHRTWQAILDEARSIAPPVPRLGVNLAPIGPIPPAVTAGLARDLAAAYTDRAAAL